MKKLWILEIAGLAAGLQLGAMPVAAGGGGGFGAGPCAGFSAGDQLVMRDNCFDGVAHFAPSRSTLVVVNQGILPHSFTAVDGSFDTGVLQPGETAEIPLPDDAAVRVHCTLHGSAEGAGMAGVLLVGNPSLHAPEFGITKGIFPPAAAHSAEPITAEEQGRAQELPGAASAPTGSRSMLMAGMATGGLLGAFAIGLGSRAWSRRKRGD